MRTKKLMSRGIKLISFILIGCIAVSAGLFAQNLPANPPSGYYDVNPSNPQGEVDYITYGSNYPARVYMPPGYPQDAPYASMYLLHGMGGSEASWHDNDLYAHIQLDNLIAQGAVDGFVIVFTKNDLSGWNFTDILIDQLIPYIERNYEVSTEGAHRALGGLSMGCGQTQTIANSHVDMFHYLMPSSCGGSFRFTDGGTSARENLKLALITCGEREGDLISSMVNSLLSAGVSSDIIFSYVAPNAGHDRNTWRPSFWNFAQMAHQRGFTTGSSGPNITPVPSSDVGDVDDNNVIDITDALKIAQSYVGLPVSGTYIPSRADTNCDGTVNIVDALLIARYYVGLISGFC